MHGRMDRFFFFFFFFVVFLNDGGIYKSFFFFFLIVVFVGCCWWWWWFGVVSPQGIGSDAFRDGGSGWTRLHFVVLVGVVENVGVGGEGLGWWWW